MDDKMKSYGDMLAEAATHLQVALELLDRARAPAHIGAHVDLAATNCTINFAAPWRLRSSRRVRPARRFSNLHRGAVPTPLATGAAAILRYFFDRSHWCASPRAGR